MPRTAPANFAAVQAEASALLTSNPSPASFPSAASRVEWYRAKLTVAPRWAFRALVVVYARQTADEQATGATKEDNAVGFGAFDADILTSFARQVERWNADTAKRYPSPLSPKQLALLHKRIRKYAAQLISHLEAEGKALPIVKEAKAPKVATPASMFPGFVVCPTCHAHVSDLAEHAAHACKAIMATRKARTVDHPDLRTSPADTVAPHPDTIAPAPVRKARTAFDAVQAKRHTTPGFTF